MQQVIQNGIALTNYIMKKKTMTGSLSPASPGNCGSFLENYMIKYPLRLRKETSYDISTITT